MPCSTKSSGGPMLRSAGTAGANSVAAGGVAPLARAGMNWGGAGGLIASRFPLIHSAAAGGVAPLARVGMNWGAARNWLTPSRYPLIQDSLLRRSAVSCCSFSSSSATSLGDCWRTGAIGSTISDIRSVYICPTKFACSVAEMPLSNRTIVERIRRTSSSSYPAMSWCAHPWRNVRSSLA